MSKNTNSKQKFEGAAGVLAAVRSAVEQLKAEEWEYLTIDGIRWDSMPERRRGYGAVNVLSLRRSSVQRATGFIMSMEEGDRLHLLEVCEASAAGSDDEADAVTLTKEGV